jgi:UDPglucose 6-dehydrogenase
MYKVAMIGCGKLGLPCAEVMASTYEVKGYDVNKFESSLVKQVELKEAIRDAKFIFVAVPTPHDSKYGGELPIANLPVKDFDYSIVRDILKKVNEIANKDQLVVLISTVLPGTVRSQLRPLITNARFIYNPYLIAMGSVSWDMVNPEMVIIGTDDGSLTGDAQELVDFYKPLMQNNPRYEVGTWDEAESIKIFYNTFISAKIGLVNMIQDVAEKIGNINVDVVTTALSRSTHRITGPSYMKAGLGDAGACHPRDNIALRFLADKLDLGYDLFHAIMSAREIQAENMAKKLVSLAKDYNLDKIWIHGKAYKPNVPYEIGSYSILVGYYVEQHGFKVNYVDPLTGDLQEKIRGVILMAHHAPTTYSNVKNDLNKEQPFYCEIESGSVILDPWRYLNQNSIPNCVVVQYGNTRGL